MYSKTLLILLLSLLPFYASGGFYVKKYATTVIATTTVNAAKAAGYPVARDYTTTSRATTPGSWSDKDYGIVSFIFAMAGLVAGGIMIVFWPVSLLGVCIAAAGVVILGLGALGSGYMGIGGAHHTHQSDKHAGTQTHKKRTTLADVGFMLGIIESLPVLLTGGLFASIFQIGRFVFRRKHKKINEPTTQTQPGHAPASGSPVFQHCPMLFQDRSI